MSSTMRALGAPLPSFELPDTRQRSDGGSEVVSDASLRGHGPSVVAFICNHCPYVVHLRAGLVEFGKYCQENGVPFVAISSNDVNTHPQDGPGQMAAEAKRHGFPFPYLYDESQDVARAFDAACTPDFFVFDAEARLAYRGQFDASRPSNSLPVTGADLRAAIEALRAGKAPSSDQKASIGCGIKWKRWAPGPRALAPASQLPRRGMVLPLDSLRSTTLIDPKFLPAFAGWLRVMGEDVLSLANLLDAPEAPLPFRRAAAEALHALLRLAELIPEGIEALGYLEGAFAFRVIAERALAGSPEPSSDAVDGRVPRLAADAAIVTEFLGEDLPRFREIWLSPAATSWAGRAASDLLDDEALRQDVQRDARAWVEDYHAPELGDGPEELVKIQAFFRTRLRRGE